MDAHTNAARRLRAPRVGPTGQKILLLLLGGIALGFGHSPKKYFEILRGIKKSWEWIDKQALNRSLRKLEQSKLIEARDNEDGTATITLSNFGKIRALTYQIDEVKIKPMKKWDCKWRVVLFDIPERHKRARDALSRKFKDAGFHQFQKSVFINPFECTDEINFITEFFNVRPYVRLILAEKIDNEVAMRKHFKLS